MNSRKYTDNAPHCGTIILRPHWAQWFIGELPLLLLCLAFIVCIGLDSVRTDGWICGATILLALYLLYRFVHWRCVEYTLTDRRLIVRSGILSVTENYLQLYRITDIRMDAPLLYRLFGIKKVLILSRDRTTPRLWLYGVPSDLPIEYILMDLTEQNRRNSHIYESLTDF